jgi:hypothetical protein
VNCNHIDGSLSNSVSNPSSQSILELSRVKGKYYMLIVQLHVFFVICKLTPQVSEVDM